MFTASIETTFNAAHQLTFAGGKKEDLHRHNWTVQCVVGAEKLNKTGVVIDFNELMEKLENITAPLKEAVLEKLPYFKDKVLNVSAENMAKYIFDSLEPLLPQNVTLRFVEVEEAPGCRAKYNK